MRCVNPIFAAMVCLAAAGCSHTRTIHLLKYPADYRPPDTTKLKAYTDAQKAEYCRGYEEGWRQVAKRFRVIVNGGFATEGDWTECAKDESPFQVGFSRGQEDAGFEAIDRAMKLPEALP